MDKFDLARSLFDEELALVDVNVEIAFGEELFLEFKRRNWLTLENFSVLGTTLFAIQLPAYNKTHFSFSSWDIGSLEFRVGRPGNGC